MSALVQLRRAQEAKARREEEERIAAVMEQMRLAEERGRLPAGFARLGRTGGVVMRFGGRDDG